MRGRRKKRGSAIAEAGPALYIFFIIIFFPMLDLMGIMLQFGCTWYLNHIATRELALRRSTEQAAVVGEVNSAFQATGVGQFAGLTSINHNVIYGSPDLANGLPGMLTCITTTTGRPFIWVPLPMAVDGLNKDMTFVIRSERPREENR